MGEGVALAGVGRTSSADTGDPAHPPGPGRAGIPLAAAARHDAELYVGRSRGGVEREEIAVKPPWRQYGQAIGDAGVTTPSGATGASQLGQASVPWASTRRTATRMCSCVPPEGLPSGSTARGSWRSKGTLRV